MPKPFKISGPEEYADIKKRALAERVEWRRRRLQAVQMGMSGSYSRERIAEVTGLSVRTIGRQAAAFRQGGVAALLTREHKGGSAPALDKEVLAALLAGLAAGRFTRAKEVRAWLQQEHGVELTLSGTYFWLGKVGGVVKVPRPTHAKKDAAAAKAFPEELPGKLAALALADDARVRVWVLDEHRYGLHGTVRRCWGLRGQRTVVERQIRYEWGYAYGALELGEGGAECWYLPTVNKECSQLFLEHLAASDPQAEHIVIQDQAGFHLRAGEAGVPARVHLVSLPAYSPELNPVEQLWDIAKDACGNRHFADLDGMETAITAELQEFWSQPTRVKQLLGNHPIHLSANASYNIERAMTNCD